jgi:hypothetical protein
MLRNGVPVGYVLASALFGSAEIAFNVFETFRGGDSAWVYGRVLAAVRALLGARDFSVPPYQLGHENEEGLASGAWWFYAKLGLEPLDPATRALARGARADLVGSFPIGRLAERVARRLGERGFATRAEAERALAGEVAARLGLRGWRRWSASERQALERWAPVLDLIPDLARWGRTERAALAALVRAKGGRRESDYVQAFDRHRRLRRALCALAGVRSSV